MDKTFLRLIELIRKVIKNDTGELNKELFPDIADVEMWKAVYKLAMNQEVQTFLYEATKDLELPEIVRNNFYSVYNRAVRKEAIVHLEVSKCIEDFRKAGVVCAPIKGWNLKNLYEKPYLRTMTDVDIIIREDGFDKACGIMLENGFHLESDIGNHFTYTKKPVTEVELHHRLFSENSMMYRWGIDVLAKSEDYSMSIEDTYIYMVAHMAKHITKEGAGMRNVIDSYLYNKKVQFTRDYTG